MKNNNGYTLVELVVVMALFIGVVYISSSAFSTILNKTSQQVKSAESQIEGFVGLEMLRYDVEHAGYGLPWTYPVAFTLAYSEVAAGASPVAGIDPSAFNEAPSPAPQRPPRAVIGAPSTTTSYIINAADSTDDATNPGVDYLVIKSVLTPLGATAKHWSYVNYSTQGAVNKSYLKNWGVPLNDMQGNDRTVTLTTNFGSTGAMTKQLVTNGNAFSYPVNTTDIRDLSTVNAAFKPPDPTQMYITYALNNISGSGNPVMPYNRADYFVKRPIKSSMPAACNKGTGILYKATVVNDSGRALNYAFNPLIDCVGDLQVVFLLDMNDDGTPGTFANHDGSINEPDPSKDGPVNISDVQATLADPTLLRQRLKEVLVYILTHEGSKDNSFRYPADTIVVSDPIHQSVGRVWTAATMTTAFGADWRNFRWKVYALSIRPKNLN